MQSNAAPPSSVPGTSHAVDSLHIDSNGIPANSPPTSAPTRGFLHIVRHSEGASAIYVVTYRRLDRPDIQPKPILAEGARTLIDVLERLGVDLRLGEVRGALKDVLRLGSANILDLWLSDEQMAEKGLVEE
ncbi:MAG TPA: hypothetical protein VIM00_09315 [Candidatus Acidoferrum sp.]